MVAFSIYNTTAEAYQTKEGCTNCRVLNSLARKILLKCYKNRVSLYGIASRCSKPHVR